jgi:multiple sugar transport system substrate-binding protein
MTKTEGRARAAGLLALMVGVAGSPAAAQELSMWARDSGAVLNEAVVGYWNELHPDQQIELTIIPANEMVTKFVTAASSGGVPDLLSLDLIFAPPFMKAGFLTDVTDQVTANPHWGDTVQAHRDLATFEDRFYGIPYAPDNSILIFNKDLFQQAGLDPEDPPSTSAEVLEAARKIRALGDDIYGFYFSGSCGGCNIFTMAPQMWATPDTTVIPRECGDEGLIGDSIPAIYNHYRTMWDEGLIPEAAQVDGGANFLSTFASGKIGMAGTGNFSVGILPKTAPDLDFGVAPLPGGTEGEISSFAGGDILTIPARANNPDGARAFMEWVLTDEAQQFFVDSGNMPARTDVAATAFAGNDRLETTLEALQTAQTPYSMAFFALSNDPAGPWLQAIQTAVFDGDVEGAIATGKQQMQDILCDG